MYWVFFPRINLPYLTCVWPLNVILAVFQPYLIHLLNNIKSAIFLSQLRRSHRCSWVFGKQRFIFCVQNPTLLFWNLETILIHCSLLVSSPSYPENGVVAMKPIDVRPRARTLLRWDQLQVGMRVMVNYNLETPEERGFWFDAEVQTVNQTSRTSKELRVKILLGWGPSFLEGRVMRWVLGTTSITVVVLVLTSMFPLSIYLHLWFSCSFIRFFLSLFPPAARRLLPRGPGDVIGDCKVQFLDEIYQVEKPGSRALSAADGPFKRT